MKSFSIVIFSCLLAVLISRCIDPFSPPATQQDIRYLVVDGFLNATDNSCAIKLTRTIPIYYDSSTRLETNAIVQLQDDHGNVFTFNESDAGEYSLADLPLNHTYQYRLKINTKNNSEYISDYVSILNTPAIDSLSWGYVRNGVPIYIDTHDSENSTHYYSWSFAETWAYTSAYASFLKEEGGQIVPTTENTYYCWRTQRNTEILISTSTSLNKDIISQFALTTIPWSSPRFRTKYSIEAEQHALSKDAYNYSLLLKRNTENLGTLFDPLPSTVIGNIHCTNNASEIPIGFFTACTTQKKRIFIKGEDINKHRPGISIITGYEECVLDSTTLTDGLRGDIPVYPIYLGSQLTGYWAASPFCVDCRQAGGVNVKPDFWE